MKPHTADVNAALWGKRANDWAEIQEATCRPVYLAVFDRLGVHPGSALFDAGCGAGMAAQIAAERGAVVTGLDASSDLLAIARKRVPAGDFHLGELERLPFPDDKFDLVTGFNSFQYAGNPGVALSEAQRVAKPQATIAVITWGQPEGMEAATLVAALKPLLPPLPLVRRGRLLCRRRPRCVPLRRKAAWKRWKSLMSTPPGIMTPWRLRCAG